MFDHLDMAPPDAIMGLTDTFRKDPNPNKINLTIGVYANSEGKTPVFAAVKKAEERLVREEPSKSYLSIEGTAEFARAVQGLVFGKGHDIVSSGRAATAHTPGGTGALRVAADLLHTVRPEARVWLSDPTWPNHTGVFTAAGLEVKTYPYYDEAAHALDFESMFDALSSAGDGDVVVFHACCHNPTGMDPTPEQWAQLAGLAHDRGFLPFFDFAYQGLGDGLEEDAQALRSFCAPGRELIVASSFSKNFGLYRERTGALTIVTQDGPAAETVLSHMKRTIRTNYSSPPAHGALAVTTILADSELREDWHAELKEMCARIHQMRGRFVEGLKEKGVSRDFSFLARQKGMFSYSGLTPEQVDRLREEFSVYIVRSGRINVASMTESNMDRLCQAIAAVLQ